MLIITPINICNRTDHNFALFRAGQGHPHVERTRISRANTMACTTLLSGPAAEVTSCPLR